MKNNKPPLLATWMVEHLYPKSHRKELVGDLSEEFEGGRTSGWYWRQALSAMSLGLVREIWSHRLAFVFAIVWTVPARALWFLLFGFAVRHYEILLRISYPGSLFFAMQAVVWLQIWMGTAIYSLLLSLVHRRFSFEQVGHGLWAGPCVFMLISIPMTGLPGPLMIGDRLIRLLPFLMCMIAALWPIGSAPAGHAQGRIAEHS